MIKSSIQKGLLSGSALLLLCGLVSCSSTAISLDYLPGPAQSVPGPRMVAVGRFGDMRGTDPYYLGSVRTPIGTPLESVTTNVTVEEVVRNSFAYGLKSRHMLVPQTSAPFVVTGEVLELSAQQVVRPAAYAKVRVNLVRAVSGQVLYSREFYAQREGGAYMPGTGSPVPVLRELASRALQEVVDRTLDDVNFRAVLRQDVGGPPAY